MNANPSVISQAEVRHALDAMLYLSGHHKASTLTNLTLIEDFLSDPIMPPSMDTHEFALNSLLISCIRDQFAFHRQAFGLAQPDTSITQQDALLTIAADAQVGSSELLGWGWLYYHYVRVDLHITSSLFAEITHIDSRTLRRYQHYGLKRLTMHLIERERMARSDYQQRRLQTALPNVVPTRLFGREKDMDRIRKLLSGPPPHHVQVVGASGVGKTMFVQEAVREQIMAHCVDEVIWLDKPVSIEYLHAQLGQKIPYTTLRDFTARFNLILILDTTEMLERELGGLERLLRDLGKAVVYLVNPSPLPLLDVSMSLLLRELNFETAIQFMRSIIDLEAAEAPYLIDNMHGIFDAAGGNPRAIKRRLYELKKLDQLSLLRF